MERIININLQGRVIPIGETAYNNLKQYIDSLRKHFANEEGSDEIINDIEYRIAELLSQSLKQGAGSINSNDLDAVINSIGRVDEIEAAEGEETTGAKSNPAMPENDPLVKGHFFRNIDDKIIAGVCSGIANRTGIDPIVVRVLFVLLFGALVWIYVLLWIVVPSKSIWSNITRRLYRNPDDKVIAGVCGGLAVYLRTASWIPRLVFVLPLFITVASTGVHMFWWHWPGFFGPRMFTGGFSSTLFILYVILWIALPYANSTTDKLEMRGERIDLDSIKAASRANTTGTYPTKQYGGSGLGRVISILFKAFFMFIGGMIALSFFGALIGLVFGGIVAMPFTCFFLDSWSQNALMWSGIILFLGIPFLALITWIIRRLVGARSRHHYLGYVFACLWLVGFVSLITLTGIFISNFSSKSVVEEPFAVRQPSISKLYINAMDNRCMASGSYHFGWIKDWDGEQGPLDNEDAPFRIINKDSLWLNTVKVNVTQSADSLYHIYMAKISRGQTSDDAKKLAGHIIFNIMQQDSVITLPAGFTISSKDKFRNQQVMVTVEVPMGKEINFGKGVDNYNWFNINVNGHKNFYFEHDWDDNNYGSGKEYTMTPSGLKNNHPQEAIDTSSNKEDENEEN
jgi:phage shock protein PspC (stress-responsive transcriptional regulator)